MYRLKFTSPGALLIIAISLAGGILLLDQFFLRTYVDGQKNAALREQAGKAEQAVRQVIASDINLLANICVMSSCAKEITAAVESDNAADGFAAYAQKAFVGPNISVAWLSAPDGRVFASWSMPSEGIRPEEIQASGGKAIGADGTKTSMTGLMRLANLTAMYARHPIVSVETGSVLGYLTVTRLLDSQEMARIGMTIGGNLVLTRAESLPPAVLADASASHAVWPMGDDRLAVAWLAVDPAGRTLGYFRADMPVTQVYGQAAVARRIILIVLALSMGLVMLIVTGTHMLIAGPVVRLLKRLQQFDNGATLTDLTRDLHGEPLMLARKLESAFEKLAHMSKTDQLTGLANRRHFQEVLECFYHQSRRYNRPLSLIVLDVDFFKAVNDTVGHQAGDEVLCRVAQAIQNACRKADMPVRLGGDEFAVLLPETFSDDAESVARRILDEVSKEPVSVKGVSLNLTISIGIADLNAGEISTPDAMIAMADRALYAAKETGRNRVCLAHDLNGISLKGLDQKNRKVDVLCRKLAGLDTRFKDLFLQAVEEVVQVLEQRDPNMADHARKVQHYAVLITQEMGLPARVIKHVQIAAMLHDIGMLVLPDSVLLAPGTLDSDKTQSLVRHPLLSVRIMEGMEFLEQEIPAVRYHHERFDGKGYPEGLSGMSIPLTARILAVADTFDAMTSQRTFRPAKSRQEALRELKAVAGTQLDPAVVDAFLAVADRMGETLMELPRADHESRWREEIRKAASTPDASAPKAEATPASATALAVPASPAATKA